MTHYSPTADVAALRLLTPEETELPVSEVRQFRSMVIPRGETLATAVVVLDSRGVFDNATVKNLDPMQIHASSNVRLLGSLRVDVNTTTGIAFFSDLALSPDVPLGVQPAITFTAQATQSAGVATTRRVRPISSGLIASRQTGRTGGVDVVAEVLFDKASFDFTAWRVRLAKRMNIEVARILPLLSIAGTGADPDDSGTVVEDQFTGRPVIRAPSWRGTRIEIRFLPPLPSSRDTKSPEVLANFFVNLEPSCKVGELFLRSAFLKSRDRSCDWNIFDEQMNGVRSCIQARKKQGYCSCHVPLLRHMGLRCLGLPRLSTLCLDVLLNSRAANCKDTIIVNVCSRLQFPDAPRAPLAGSGAFLALFFPPLAYSYWKGLFHKLHRPSSGEERIAVMETAVQDAHDML